MLRQVMREAFSNLLAARQRSALALLGILIGAGAVIAMLNVGAMARNETVQQFRQMGTDILSLRSTDLAFALADVRTVRAAVPQARLVAPLVQGGGSATFEGNVRSTTVIGATEALAAIASLRVRDGRLLSDFDRYELFCVLGSQLVEELSGSLSHVRVGSRVRLGRYVFMVLGILEPSMQSPMMPVDLNDSILVSIPNMRRVSPEAGINTVLVRLAPGGDSAATTDALQSFFTPRLRGVVPEVQTAKQLIEGMARQVQLFELLLCAVGVISLVLGGVGVMNVMLVSVQERRREIGIRLAIGARRLDIQVLFLAEAVILALLGAGLGIGLGVLASYGFAKVSNWTFIVSAAAAPLGAGASVAIGVFFGFYPAWLASRMDPIEALRAE